MSASDGGELALAPDCPLGLQTLCGFSQAEGSSVPPSRSCCPLHRRRSLEVLLERNPPSGIDGFNDAFYQVAWHIIAKDLLFGVNNFLKSSILLGQVNHTLICLAPKKVVPTLVDDYRPIALCNVLYCILSKLLAIRHKPLMPKLIDMNQSAIILGSKIIDSILLAHELCQNIHSSQGRARMCIKLDLSKAFDSLNRQFICDVFTQPQL